MKSKIDARTHEEWKNYLGRGGVLDQTSFIRFYERYPQVLKKMSTHELTSDAHEAASASGLTKITAQFCAAFATLREYHLTFRNTKADTISWRNDEWHVREALLLINDQQASQVREQTY